MQTNEIGLVLKKHGRLDHAANFFKKALLYMKRRYKSSYK